MFWRGNLFTPLIAYPELVEGVTVMRHFPGNMYHNVTSVIMHSIALINVDLPRFELLILLGRQKGIYRKLMLKATAVKEVLP